MSTRRGIVRPQQRRPPDAQVGTRAAQQALADPHQRLLWRRHLAIGARVRWRRGRDKAG